MFVFNENMWKLGAKKSAFTHNHNTRLMLNKEEYDFVKRSGTVLGGVAMLAMVVSNGGSAFRV
jgi:hypothetical protein